MQLDNMRLVARPRQPWEAVDLGLGMARRWWWPLLFLWLVLALPVGLLAWLSPLPKGLIPVLLWWFKPLFERPQLYFLSRVVFGETPRLREVLRQLPRLLWPQSIASLTWRRLSPSRSYDLPPLLLEGLSGAARKRRLKLLHGAQYGQACWLTIIGVHLESLLYFSLTLLVAMLVPSGKTGYWMQYLADSEIWNALISLVAMAMIAPFYVAGGFGLYLNRRTHLEAWDIELAFRRLAQRLQGRATAAMLLSALAFGFALTGLMPERTHASPAEAPEAGMYWEASTATTMDPEEARELIDEILASEEFVEHDTIRFPTLDLDFDWEWPASDETEANRLLQWLPQIARFLASSFEVLVWVLVGVAVLVILVRYRVWLPYLRLPGRTPHPEAANRPEWFNLESHSRLWPQHLIAEVLRLWQAGEPRAALGLLYSASLDRLVEQGGLVLAHGATEGDYLRLVRSRCDQALAAYFARLTWAWLRLAYGHDRLSESDLRDLCQEWDRFFGATARLGPMAKDEALPGSSRTLGADGCGGSS